MKHKSQPNSKEDQIISKLNEMVESKTIDEFTIKRFKVEAEKIKGIDLAAAFSILGMIACLEKDIKNMHSYHKSAITYTNEGVVELSHYVVSLTNCELFPDVYIYAKKVYEKDPSNLKNIDMLIRAANELDLEDEFQKYVDKWLNLKSNPHELVTFPEDNDEKLLQILEEFDKLINDHPNLILKPDPELIKLADNLVEGVRVTN